MRALNNGVIYLGNDANGREPWFSDGTDSGTFMIKDIAPGGQSSSLSFGGIAFGPPNAQKFLIASGLTWSRTELYTTDGTLANTYRVKDIYDDEPNTTPVASGSKPTNFTQAGNYVYFQARSFLAGTELYRTDGTEAGTTLIKDLNPGVASSLPEKIVSAGSLVYFAADDGTGKKLWQTDGTSAGTILVRTAGGDSFKKPLTAVALNGVLYFAGNQTATGSELWRTDGTSAGTYLVKDLVNGSASSHPTDMQVYDGKIYFAATTDGTSTFNLWVTDGTASGTVAIPGFSGSVGHPPFVLGSFGEVGNKATTFELVVSCTKDNKRVMRNFRSC